MTHGSLFSGIGGFDLAAEWMGWENKFHCEWNEFGKKVLKYNESIKGYGNAIVPQIALEIFKAIQSYEQLVEL